MKRVRPEADGAVPLSTVRPCSGSRDAALLSATLNLGTRNAVVKSACLRCPDEPCTRYDVPESGNGNPIPVCPTSAIGGARTETGPTIGETCIGCGLCAVRCPVGAIEIENERAYVNPPMSSPGYQPVDEIDFKGRRNDVTIDHPWKGGQWEDAIDVVSRAAAPQRQDAFYSLVASLFTMAGFPAWRPAQGDTSNRIDLILIDRVDSIPVEVKSRTETQVISVKAVQQALENRIVLDGRTFFPSQRESTSLAVGFEYPPARSDIAELVEDIFKAFGIKVGLIALPTLVRLAFERQLFGTALERTVLASLKGAL